MKWLRRPGGWLVVLALVLAWAPTARAQSTQNFSITDFTADYYLSRDADQAASLKTVETITAQFPSYDQNHGILRALPQTYQNHTISLKIDSVTDENGQPIKFSTSSSNDNLVLKIGDAHAYVHNQKIYKITYESKNVASLLADHDEFYWDVNGDQWEQPFGQVTAYLHVAGGLAERLQDKQICYAGYGGSSNSRGCSVSQPAPEAGGQLITAQASQLQPGQTLTFVVGFGAGTFKLGPEIAQAQRDQKLKDALIAAVILLPSVVSFIYLYTKWRRYGRDPKGRGVIIPEYQPPKGLNVLTSDYILRENLNDKAITALIIELAIRGYLTISETTKKKRLQRDTTSYSLKLNRAPEGLSDEEIYVLTMFFGTPTAGATVDIDTLKNKLSTKTASLKTLLAKNLVQAGYFKNNPTSAGNNYYLAGGILALGGFFGLSFIYPPAGFGAGLAGIIFLIFGRYMPARSDAGVTVRDHMLGLRDYIKLAEADRLKFLQSPQGAEKIQQAGLDPADPSFRVKLFESLLPYAMVFSLEKDWAKQFEDVYRQPPSWYSGNWAAFNAGYLASSLSGFNSASAVTFTAPSSSGSSGFGGGFSGGGGGGGGGGGW